jgi:hypothetical protein
MSAFAQGFALGGDLASQAQKLQLAAEVAEREKERFGWEREQQQLEKQGRQAALETYGRVGTQDYTQAIQQQGGAGSQQAQMLSNQAAGMGAENEAASAQSVTNAMRENAGKEAITSALPSQTYTAEQANQDYVKRMYALNPEKAQQSELAGLQLKNVKREAKLAEDFDKENLDFRNTLTKIYSIAETGGMKGLAEAAEKEGLKTKFVEGKNGMGTIQLLGPKGDVIKTFTDVKSATEALAGAAQTKFTKNLETMFGSADKAAAFYQQQQQLKNKERETDIHQEFYGKGGTYERVGMARVAASGNRGPGGVNSASNQDKILTNQAEILMRGQPNKYKDIDQAKFAILNSKLKLDDTGTQWRKMELKMVEQGLADIEIRRQKEAFFAREGFAPQAVIDAAASGIRPDGKPFTEADKNAFYQKYPNSIDVEFGTPKTPTVPEVKSAIPTEKAKTEVKTSISPKQATPEQKQAFDQKQEAIAKEANERKEKNQAIKVDKQKAEQTRIAKEQQIQKQRENEARTNQINALEVKKEKALKKGDEASAKIIDSNIARIKKQLQD